MMPTSEDTLRHIERLRLFRGLSERERAIVAAVFRPHGLKQGEVLCQEGDSGRSFFITVEGTIEIYKEVGAGRVELLSKVGPDNVLGQISLIDHQARSATLRAGSTALVLECSADDFDRLFWAGTPFAYKLLDMMVTQLAHRLREANRGLYDLFSNPQKTLMKLHEAAIDIERAAHDHDFSGGQ